MTYTVPIGTIAGMDHVNKFIAELDVYAESLGVQPDTICRKATGNPRLLPRLERRARQIEESMSAVRSYMISHPVSETRAPSKEAAE